MRFPIAALFFLVSSFIFGVCWAVSAYLISIVHGGMAPLAERLGSTPYDNMLGFLPWAFGIICAIFFITGILMIFLLDSLSEEPEYYYR